VILDSYSTSGKGEGRVDERWSDWKPICSQLRLEIPTVPSGTGLALNKLLIATGNILPKSCPVRLADLA